MIVLSVFFALVSAAPPCVVKIGDYFFDFTSLAQQRINLSSPSGDKYDFTFCGVNTCGSDQSSICQTASDGTYNLGTWDSAANWTVAGPLQFSGEMYGANVWCPGPRVTNVTFSCVDGPAKLTSIAETSTCVYEAQINVPLQVCSAAAPCCTPATYTSSRVENDGSLSVVQTDVASGNWLDSDFQGKGSGVLCLKSYDRCFTYTATTCSTAPWRAAPSQCFGSSSGWKVLKKGVLVTNVSPVVEQTAWISSDSGYVVTTPLGGPGFCVPVSGNSIGTSFDFGLVPNSTYWQIPKICVKFM